MRLLTLAAAAAEPFVLPAEIGAAYKGGFFAGVIDNRHGNIIAGDAYQAGRRYALIVSAKSLETYSVDWFVSSGNADAAAKTRWDGLSAQDALVSASYPAFEYCNGLSYPADGASKWYLPALDELELLYRNLKPTTASNDTGTVSGSTFPGGTLNIGENPSSYPTGVTYTSGSPAQTAVADFRSTGSEVVVTGNVWSATAATSTVAWAKSMTDGGESGWGKQTGLSIRPVRRFYL